MQRIVFERNPVDGFRSTRTETIAMTSAGKRLFAGTNDGSLVLYECRPDTYGTTSKSSSDTYGTTYKLGLYFYLLMV